MGAWATRQGSAERTWFLATFAAYNEVPGFLEHRMRVRIFFFFFLIFYVVRTTHRVLMVNRA